MNIPDSTMAAMRAATHEIHHALEQGLAIGAPGAGKREYLDYIAAFWGWLAPFEAKLWQASWPPGMEAQMRDGKRLWILQDLRDAGQSEALRNLPQAPHVPSLDTAAQRFGWAYVIEGSQLGNQVLRKRLAPQLSPWQPRWLMGYGDETARRWKSYIGCAEASLVDTAARAQAAQAAFDAFRSLATWLDGRGVARVSMRTGAIETSANNQNQEEQV